METTEEWVGSATKLLAKLTTNVDEKVAASRDWPKRADTLSNRLIEHAPLLRSHGIEVTRGREGGGKRKRFIRLAARTRGRRGTRDVGDAVDNCARRSRRAFFRGVDACRQGPRPKPPQTEAPVSTRARSAQAGRGCEPARGLPHLGLRRRRRRAHPLDSPRRRRTARCASSGPISRPGSSEQRAEWTPGSQLSARSYVMDGHDLQAQDAKTKGVVYDIKYRTGDGTQVKKAVGPTAAEAQRRLNAALAAVDRGEQRTTSTRDLRGGRRPLAAREEAADRAVDLPRLRDPSPHCG